jgi:hypothetical protein
LQSVMNTRQDGGQHEIRISFCTRYAVLNAAIVLC